MAQVAVSSLLVAALFSVQNAAALTVTAVTSGNGHPAHQVQWTDGAGLPRTAIMVDQSASGPGYLYQLTYQFNGSPRVCAGTGSTGYPGDGFVENHNTQGSDNNSLDNSTPGTTTVVLSGSSHAIIAYDMPTYRILGETIPTTIYWFFADGRDNPIFAISQDARATPGNLGGDTRSPYGSMNFDGGNGASDVGGASYGDTLKFVTLAGAPELVTGLSGWSDTEANTIPYAMEWVSSGEVDAEMGHVATLPITILDQGADRDANSTLDPRNQQALNGPMIPYGASDTGPDAWAFQLLDYILHPDYQGDPQGAGATIQVTWSKLAWGGNFGRVGGYNNGNAALDGTQYSEHYDCGSDILTGTRADGLLMAYSVFVVLGTHNGSYLTGAVGTQVTQMEHVALATLGSSIGTVVASGPAGVGNAANATITYSPAGYNPTYAAWEIAASGNAVNATLTPAATYPLAFPVFIIDNYTKGSLPSSISVTISGSSPSYYASLDTVNSRLWITVTTPSPITSATPLNLVVSESEVPAPGITSFTPASGTVGTSVTITGQNFKGTIPTAYTTSAVAFNGVSAILGAVSATSIQTTVPAGATTGPITVTTPGGTATSTGSSTPTFTPTYTLSVVAAPSSGDGTVTAGGIIGGGSLAGGPETLIATANTGYVFANWTQTPGGGQLSASPSYIITLNADETFYANFLMAPEIEVLNGLIVITNGQTNAVDFGSVQQNQTGPILTFTVTNSGGQPLGLGTPTVPSGYTLVTNPPATIPAGSDGAFSVQLNSTTVGASSGDITITNNANYATNSPFVFPITGLVTAEIISLSGNLVFGGVALNTSSNLTLTIGNTGNLTLTITNISYPPGFGGAFSNTITIAPGGSTNVLVTFSPTIASNYSGTVTVNSDATGGTDTIPISGFGANGTLVLTIDISGNGSVSPDLNGQTLNAGTKHTIRAVPTAGSGEIFAGWSGSTNSTKNPLTFTMEISTVLQANFIPNPFPPFVGTYNGLFTNTNGIVTKQSAGMLKGLTISKKGTYSGSLLINGGSHAISGAFFATSQSSNFISRPTGQGGPLVVEMTLLNSSNSAPQVTGTVSNASWVANLTAYRATNTVPSAEYTMLIPPDTSNTPPNLSPGGDGYALITNHVGKATITGALADGAAFSQTVPVSQHGCVPIYANLYGGKGLLLGWINLDITNTTDVGLTWIHPGTHSGLYQNGFTNVLLTNQIQISQWTNSPGNFDNLTNLSMLETINDTNTPIAVMFSTSGKVTGPSVSGSVNLKTGLLTVTIGSGASKVTGHGAILLNATTGGGYFLTKTNAQAIELGP